MFFTIGQIVIRHEVILVEGITYDCVLGMDLLEKTDYLCMTFRNPIACEISVHGVVERFEIGYQTVNTARIYVERDTVLLPRSIGLISITTDNSFNLQTKCCLMESLINSPQQIQLTPQCWERPSDVMLYNPQPITVTLYKHTPVGVVHAIKQTKKPNVHVNTVSTGKIHPEEKDDLFEAYRGTPYYNLLKEFSDVTARI